MTDTQVNGDEEAPPKSFRQAVDREAWRILAELKLEGKPIDQKLLKALATYSVREDYPQFEDRATRSLKSLLKIEATGQG